MGARQQEGMEHEARGVEKQLWIQVLHRSDCFSPFATASQAMMQTPQARGSRQKDQMAEECVKLKLSTFLDQSAGPQEQAESAMAHHHSRCLSLGMVFLLSAAIEASAFRLVAQVVVGALEAHPASCR